MVESVFGLLLVNKSNTKIVAMQQNFSLIAKEDRKIKVKEQDKGFVDHAKKVFLQSGSNTINLFQHLNEHHLLIFTELAPSNLLTLAPAANKLH